MRISKVLAESIAKQALAFRETEIVAAEKEVQAFIDEIAKNSTPALVSADFELHPSYFKTAKSFHIFSDVNKTEKTRNSTLNTIVPPNGWQYGIIYADAWRLTRLEKLELNLKKLETKLLEDEETLYNTILALSTKKRVLEDLPDLQLYFPAEITTTLAPNLSAVRDLLKR